MPDLIMTLSFILNGKTWYAEYKPFSGQIINISTTNPGINTSLLTVQALEIPYGVVIPLMLSGMSTGSSVTISRREAIGYGLNLLLPPDAYETQNETVG